MHIWIDGAAVAIRFGAAAVAGATVQLTVQRRYGIDAWTAEPRARCDARRGWTL